MAAAAAAWLAPCVHSALGRRGFANHELRRDLASARWARVAVHSHDEQPNRFVRDRRHGLLDRRQRWVAKLCEDDAVEARDPDVVRYPESVLVQFPRDTERDDIGATDDCLRYAPLGDEPANCLTAEVHREGTEERGVRENAFDVVDRSREGLEPAPAGRADARVRDEDDSLAILVREVLDYHLNSQLVVDADKVALKAVRLAVELDDRHARLCAEEGLRALTLVGGNDDQAVDLAVDHRLDPACFALQ